MKYYTYKYIDGIVLTVWNAEEILNNIKRGLTKFEIIVDLGLRRANVEIKNGKIYIDGNEVTAEVLDNIKEGFVYKFINGVLHRLDMYSNGKYYKLRPVKPDTAPTIEINGIHMHRIHGTDPWDDSIAKIKALDKRIKGAKVLDICTGLGYTAIAEVMFGAKSVTSIEIDENVLYLASMNPWSKGLENPKIKIILGDAYNVLDHLEPGGYDIAIHDPPRFEIAGELYSFEFYKKVFNTLKDGGILLHYTGSPCKHSNIDILKGIKSRLARAGFDNIVWIESIQGFKAYKRI